MSLQQFFDSFDDTCEPIENHPIDIQWTRKGWGFGSFRFYQKDGVVYCDSECMNRKFVKECLNILVDNAVFNDFPDEKDAERIQRTQLPSHDPEKRKRIKRPE